jgi:hypothetical protein
LNLARRPRFLLGLVDTEEGIWTGAILIGKKFAQKAIQCQEQATAMCTTNNRSVLVRWKIEKDIEIWG